MQLVPNPKANLSTIEAAVLNTIIYFDLFHHPLTTDEIHHNCQWEKCSLTEVAAALEQLQSSSIVSEKNGFWFIAGNDHFVKIRRERNVRALKFGKKAKRYSRFISKFPFVRAVFISGSLSKGTLDKNGDIDYFIITEPGRLWLARTMLVLFKKIFLLNSKKYFCVNYFIASDNLEIPDRNLFVATEIAYLLPMHGKELYNEFYESNKWFELFYPNKSSSSVQIDDTGSTWLKRFAEKKLSGKNGNRLENYFWRLTVNRWKKKFPEVDPEVFENKFRSRKNVSKHHPNGFQQRVANALEDRRKQVGMNAGLHIPSSPWEWICTRKED
ncbi:MAG TPA: nucleotidyltransferase domain-containing protein [Bacteroidia bacterium]|jgi:hypothetical protein|nr:nucleotidyltransferase domain-containing protein [Bacteroidia bacterium]